MPPARLTSRRKIPIPDPTDQPTISVPHAGKLLGLSRSSAYRAVHGGDIPSIRLGSRLVVPTAELLKMLGLERTP